MTFTNPLSASYSDSNDLRLVSESLNGNRDALDTLVKVHQPFIYNVAWKMTNEEADAADLTQEVLIKVITKLSSFEGKSSFRTWLYRIVVNEFLQTKRKAREDQFRDFDDFSAKLDGIPDAEPTPEEEIQLKEFTHEAKFRCMSGMLMCLTREQRVLYILGDLFKIDHHMGAEIFEISQENYRTKLSRARRDLHNFMNNKCGLVNSSNPCRCSKKAKSLSDKGVLTKDSFRFTNQYQSQISDYAEAGYEKLSDALDQRYIEFYQQHPSKDDFGPDTVISEIVNDKNIAEFLKM
jgi:RNA polymerase sigma factor (sigma-70 family)